METNNPYAAPKTPVEAGLRDGAPTAAAVPLYSVGQITLAAFLGSLVAAAWLGAANFTAIGQPLKGRRILWWGTAMTLAVVGVSFLLPDKFPNSVIPLATIFFARAQATRYFETVLREHETAGGELRSWWRVAGLSLLILAILFVVSTLIVAAFYLLTGKGLE